MMQHSKLKFLLFGSLICGALICYAQVGIVTDHPTEQLPKPENGLQIKKHLGEITDTGVLLGNTNYSLRIQKIDEQTLLTMPQLEIDETVTHFMPNKLVELDKPLDPIDPLNQALFQKLKSTNSPNQYE